MHQDTEDFISTRFRRPARRADTRERRRQERQLAEAMEQNGLTLAWTPRISLHDAGVLADEASVHWAPGHRAAVPAAAVMAAGTDASLASAMTLWTLRAGCACLSQQLPLSRPVPLGRSVMSLPLPRAVELDASLVAMVASVLRDFGLSPACLELRLSEMSLLQPSTEALLCLSALRDCGVGLAVDDFGRQVGSLGMLRQVPLTTLRLDPLLTHGLELGGEDALVCRATVAIGHALEMRVAAQAVNRALLLHALRSAGMDAATGAAVACEPAEPRQDADVCSPGWAHGTVRESAGPDTHILDGVGLDGRTLQ